MPLAIAQAEQRTQNKNEKYIEFPPIWRIDAKDCCLLFAVVARSTSSVPFVVRYRATVYSLRLTWYNRDGSSTAAFKTIDEPETYVQHVYRKFHTSLGTRRQNIHNDGDGGGDGGGAENIVGINRKPASSLLEPACSSTLFMRKDEMDLCDRAQSAVHSKYVRSMSCDRKTAEAVTFDASGMGTGMCTMYDDDGKNDVEKITGALCQTKTSKRHGFHRRRENIELRLCVCVGWLAGWVRTAHMGTISIVIMAIITINNRCTHLPVLRTWEVTRCGACVTLKIYSMCQALARPWPGQAMHRSPTSSTSSSYFVVRKLWSSLFSSGMWIKHSDATFI